MFILNHNFFLSIYLSICISLCYTYIGKWKIYVYLFEQNRYASILITFLDALFILHEIYLFLQRELIYKYLYLALLRDNILQRELIYMYLYLALLHHNIFPKEKIYISNIYKDISLRKWDLQKQRSDRIRSRFYQVTFLSERLWSKFYHETLHSLQR